MEDEDLAFSVLFGVQQIVTFRAELELWPLGHALDREIPDSATSAINTSWLTTGCVLCRLLALCFNEA